MRKLILVVFVLGGTAVNTIANNPITTEIATESSDNFVLIKNENGINVYFSKYNLNDKSYLEVRFENTTNQEINFTWVLTKNSELIINKTNTSVGSLAKIGRPDTSILIPINNGETFNDFSLTINLK